MLIKPNKNLLKPLQFDPTLRMNVWKIQQLPYNFGYVKYTCICSGGRADVTYYSTNIWIYTSTVNTSVCPPLATRAQSCSHFTSQGNPRSMPQQLTSCIFEGTKIYIIQTQTQSLRSYLDQFCSISYDHMCISQVLPKTLVNLDLPKIF